MLWYHCPSCILGCVVKGGRCIGSGGHTIYSRDSGVSCTLILVVLSLFLVVLWFAPVWWQGVGYVRIGYCPGLVACFVVSIWCASFHVLSIGIWICMCFVCGSPFVFSRAWSWMQWCMWGGMYNLVEGGWLWVLGGHVVVVGGGGCVLQWAGIQCSLEEGMFDDFGFGW